MFAEQTPNQLCYEKIFFLIAVTGLVLGLAGCEKDPKSVPVASVEITSESPTLEVGDKITLAAQVLPADADDKSVTWSSASPAIAIVDSTSGEVTAVGVGTVQITVTTTDGAKTDDIFGAAVIVAADEAEAYAETLPDIGGRYELTDPTHYCEGNRAYRADGTLVLQSAGEHDSITFYPLQNVFAVKERDRPDGGYFVFDAIKCYSIHNTDGACVFRLNLDRWSGTE